MVPRSGLGVWPEDWSWEGEEGVVKAAEISQRVKEMMADESLLERAQKIGNAARSAARCWGMGCRSLLRN